MTAPSAKKVMALAQARKIDAILVTELSRWETVLANAGPGADT